MSGLGKGTTLVTATGDQRIDGMFLDTRWADPIVYYSFPGSSLEYTYPGEISTFSPLGAASRATVQFALDTAYGSANNDGFSVEGFTNLNLQLTGSTNAHIRSANSSMPSTAWAYGPGISAEAGDVWFGPYTRSPQVGNYSWAATLHELGHALGLKHPHETDVYGAVPFAYDSMEYSIMSYRSYYGQSLGVGYTNEQYGFAQTYMMLDIAALQAMYGADFTTNAGNTSYVWRPGQGTTFVDGVATISSPINRIFATVWDGGGTDTYNLSAYTTAVLIDLRPGNYSSFSSSQRVYLGDGRYAHGNIYNALLFQGDTRSLIENAYGGTAGDKIVGNVANNVLAGFAGNDRLFGDSGDDIIQGGSGADYNGGGLGFDYASYKAATAAVTARLDLPSSNKGEAAGDRYSGIEGLIGSAYGDYLFGDGFSNTLNGGAGSDALRGLSGNDTLLGQDGADRLRGGGGVDIMTGGTGADIFIFDTALAGATNVDTITDFELGLDKIWLDDAIFAAAGAIGALAGSAFLSAVGGLATTALQRIIYDPATGDLFYDADGSGSGSAVRFASFAGLPSLAASDVLIF